MFELTVEQREEIKHRTAFVPRTTKAALQQWIAEYLDIEIPDVLIDPKSNMSPMDYLWEVYHQALTGADVTYSRVLAYASRDSGKTLITAILEVLMLVHLGRSCGHMAAIEKQARDAQGYVQGFLNKPYFRRFVVGNNARSKEFCRYEHLKTALNLTEKEYGLLPDEQKAEYKEHRAKIDIVICTMTGANGLHTPFFCVSGDTELLVPQGDGSNRQRKSLSLRGLYALSEGKGAGGRPPVTVEEGHLEPPPGTQVLAYDLEQARPIFRDVSMVHRRMAPAYKLRFDGGKEITATADHRFADIHGDYVRVEDLVPGASVLGLNRGKTDLGSESPEPAPVEPVEPLPLPPQSTPMWEQVVMGSLLGDGGVYRRPGNNAYMREQHGLEQEAYLRWKFSFFDGVFSYREGYAKSGYTGEQLFALYGQNTPLLNKFVDMRKTLEAVDLIDARGLAFWYQDDGCATNGFSLSTECWDEEQNRYIAKRLRERFGLDVFVQRAPKKGPDGEEDRVFWRIRGGVAAKKRLAEISGEWFHESMRYKIALEDNQGVCSFCGEVFWHHEGLRNSLACNAPLCRAVQRGSVHKYRLLSKEAVGEIPVYDITVPGPHNFFSNGLLSHNCADEVDIANRQAYEEAKMIPTTVGDKTPITVLTSTRKFAFGIVQDEIDKAPQTGLRVHHWNILDIAKPCEESRHKPHEPKVEMAVDDDNLVAITRKTYDRLEPASQERYVVEEAFAGCSVCPIYAMCRGRLATVPKPRKYPRASWFVKPIDHLINQFKTVDPQTALAQLLCRKPSQKGLIYPFLDPDVHKLTPAEIAEMVTGEEHPENFTKDELVDLFRQRGAEFIAGMDFGFTHLWSMPIAAVDGGRAFVLECLSQAELLTSQQIEIANARVSHYQPTVYADPENPQAIKEWREAGWNMRKWTKGPGSVLRGIELVRWMMRPLIGQATLYFLAGDPGVDHLFQCLQKYRWTIDAAGNPTDIPDEDGDDAPDALRYLLMNRFEKLRTTVRAQQSVVAPPEEQLTRRVEQIRRQQIMSHVSQAIEAPIATGQPIRKGRFRFSIG